MPKDIFPYIDIPVASVIWTYTGLPPDDMANRVVTICERAMTTTVNDIEHIESTSYNGVAVIRILLPAEREDRDGHRPDHLHRPDHPARSCRPASSRRCHLKYDASSVPILQLGLHSNTLSEQQLYDYGQNFIRTQLATVQGASIPLPYGGKKRAIMVDIDPDALYAKQSLRHRRFQRHEPPEPHSARRHRQDGRPRISRAAQQQSRHRARS